MEKKEAMLYEPDYVAAFRLIQKSGRPLCDLSFYDGITFHTEDNPLRVVIDRGGKAETIYFWYDDGVVKTDQYPGDYKK